MCNRGGTNIHKSDALYIGLHGGQPPSGGVTNYEINVNSKGIADRVGCQRRP